MWTHGHSRDNPVPFMSNGTLDILLNQLPLNIKLAIEELGVLLDRHGGVVSNFALNLHEIELFSGSASLHTGWCRDRGLSVRKFPHDLFVVDDRIAAAFLLDEEG